MQGTFLFHWFWFYIFGLLIQEVFNLFLSRGTSIKKPTLKISSFELEKRLMDKQFSYIWRLLLLLLFWQNGQRAPDLRVERLKWKHVPLLLFWLLCPLILSMCVCFQRIDLATSADMYLKPNTSPVPQCSSVFDVITIHLDQSNEGNAHTIEENLF